MSANLAFYTVENLGSSLDGIHGECGYTVLQREHRSIQSRCNNTLIRLMTLSISDELRSPVALLEISVSILTTAQGCRASNALFGSVRH